MRKLLIIIAAVALTWGCASMQAKTPQQHAFAVVADYIAIQAAAREYISRPTADPEISAALKSAVSRAWPASMVLRDLASGRELSFCGDGAVLIIPDTVPAEMATAACAGNLQSVTTQTELLAAALRAIIIRMEERS